MTKAIKAHRTAPAAAQELPVGQWANIDMPASVKSLFDKAREAATAHTMQILQARNLTVPARCSLVVQRAKFGGGLTFAALPERSAGNGVSGNEVGGLVFRAPKPKSK